MSAEVFVDTNVLVYARDTTEPDKQERAAAWIERLWRRQTGRLSVQILQEYYVTVTDKLDPGLDAERARADVRALQAWQPLAIDADVLELAWSIQDRYGLSWWDAQVVAAAGRSGCALLLSEDLQHGQQIAGIEVVCPFRREPV